MGIDGDVQFVYIYGEYLCTAQMGIGFGVLGLRLIVRALKKE